MYYTQRHLEYHIKEMFLLYRLEELKLPLDWLAKKLGDRFDITDLRDYLQNHRRMMPASAPQLDRIPAGVDLSKLDAQGRPQVWYEDRSVSRPYTFKAEQWLSAREMAEFRQSLAPESQKPSPQLPANIEDWGIEVKNRWYKALGLVAAFERREIDLTRNAADWASTTGALASFGEHGRELVHRLARPSAAYQKAVVDTQFDAALVEWAYATPSKFFLIASLYNIRQGAAQGQTLTA